MKDGETPAEQGRAGYARKSASLMLFNTAQPPLPQETPEQLPSANRADPSQNVLVGPAKGALAGSGQMRPLADVDDADPSCTKSPGPSGQPLSSVHSCFSLCSSLTEAVAGERSRSSLGLCQGRLRLDSSTKFSMQGVLRHWKVWSTHP